MKWTELEIRTLGELWRCASAGVVPERVSQAESAMDLFSGLWAICQFSMRSQSARIWEHLPMGAGVPPLVAADVNRGQGIELLPIKARTNVVQAAYWLMQEWPGRSRHREEG